MKILILCTGNSCRSQMAHGFVQAIDSSFQVFSGGTHPAPRVNPRAVEVMKEAGIDISNHTPTNVNEYLDEEWDYVITVCGGANESCPTFNGTVKNRLHIGFEGPIGRHRHRGIHYERISTHTRRNKTKIHKSIFIKINSILKKELLSLGP